MKAGLLLVITLALGALAASGHPLAGAHGPTRRFFEEKAGLLRPFLHVSRAGRARAPLHGDLHTALHLLGAAPAMLKRAGAREEAPVPGLSTRRATKPAPHRRGSGRKGRGRGRRK